jgi:mxaJ protein
MSSRCRDGLAVLLILLVLTAAGGCALGPERRLRVCADPNNLPFSNARGQGFENEIARLLASRLGARLEYTWAAQRRGFFRNTLDARACDVVIGVPSQLERALTTRPYYRSSYVFVYRRDETARPASFDDPVLRRLRIGVQLVGDDYANTPPVHALVARDIVSNVTGYSVLGDYAKPNPPSAIIEAVAAGDVDVALAWGPLAGFFARRSRVPLEVAPVVPEFDGPFRPLVFDISIGVRRGDAARRDQLDALLARHALEIDGILDRYSVPRLRIPSRRRL